MLPVMSLSMISPDMTRHEEEEEADWSEQATDLGAPERWARSGYTTAEGQRVRPFTMSG